MINQVILVGKVKEFGDIGNVHKKIMYIQVERPFKNTYNREYDIIECELWESIFNGVIGSCKNGDMVALRGRIENDNSKFRVVGEKLVLLNKSRDNILKVS